MKNLVNAAVLGLSLVCATGAAYANGAVAEKAQVSAQVSTDRQEVKDAREQLKNDKREVRKDMKKIRAAQRKLETDKKM